MCSGSIKPTDFLLNFVLMRFSRVLYTPRLSPHSSSNSRLHLFYYMKHKFHRHFGCLRTKYLIISNVCCFNMTVSVNVFGSFFSENWPDLCRCLSIWVWPRDCRHYNFDHIQIELTLEEIQLVGNLSWIYNRYRLLDYIYL